MTDFLSLLRRTFLVGPLLVLAGLLAPRTAHATHALGADMSYVNVAPGVYFVEYRFYRDCGGVATAPPQQPLGYAATGCGAGGAGTVGLATQMLSLNSYSVGNPYCQPINNSSPCDSAGGQVVSAFPNYQIYTYAGVVNLGSTPDRQCSNWRLTAAVGSRPEVANLMNAGGTDLYTYALLNNTSAVGDGASPKFSIVGGLQPLMVMCDSTLIRYNSGVINTEGDSLVYSLQQPLGTNNTLVPYVSGYSVQQPVRTLAGSAPLSLDANGTLTLTAGSYVSPPGANNLENKYAIVIQVDAYRRVNGVVVRAAQVRRDLAAAIISCAGSPTVPQIQPGGITVTVPGRATYSPALGAVITAQVNVPLTITAQVFDGRVTDSVNVRVKTGSLPSGATFTAPSATFASTATFTWTPTAADVRSQPHVVYFDAFDNECPVIQRACFALPIQVVLLRPAGLAATAAVRTPLRATPNPFTTETRLRVSAATADPNADVRIYDLTGRLLDCLRVPAGPGSHELTWHAPAVLPAGVYVARFASGANQQVVRLVKE